MKQLAKDTDRDVQQLAEEWLIDEEDDESFVALCPDEIERNLPDGSLSFSSTDEPTKRTSSPVGEPSTKNDEQEVNTQQSCDDVELEDIESDDRPE